MAAEEVEERQRDEAVEVDDDEEHDSKERLLHKHFLKEWPLVQSLVQSIISSDPTATAVVSSQLSSAHRIRSIFEKYQEQGQLLEPYLESVVPPLMSLVRASAARMGDDIEIEVIDVIKPVSVVVYSLVTVCGFKAVIKFFPHQVSDLELAVALLEKCHGSKSETSLRQESSGDMEAKCVVLLWLSVLVLLPFDIASIDTSVADDERESELEPSPLVVKLLRFCKDYLASAGAMRNMACLLLSKLLTRPDMTQAFNGFIKWTHEVLSSSRDDAMGVFQLFGVVQALASIFKSGSRMLLLNKALGVWTDISELWRSGTADRSPLLRKFLIKLSQRIGLAFLPHRIPSWRYMYKTTSLRGMGQPDMKSDNFSLDMEDEHADVPTIIEEIIDNLLDALKDTDTVVRWSAAKGVGRITSRLSSTLAEEVLSSVLELFAPEGGDGSWHGGCLALAELARRGLLLPNCLPKVVPVVSKALHYDVRRGPHSIGSHVRDAAAYVCWAFGRAYYHADMRSMLDQLAPHLLTVACFDREVNCRRASAAAFQENVGRQGSYPHGIDIVNMADYFSLSSRTNSYLHVAVYISQYEGYLHPFVEDLVNSKIGHWISRFPQDKSLRELAAQAVSALVKYEPDYFANYVMQKSIPSTLSPDLCMRHGATIAVAELILGLHQQSYNLPSDVQRQVANIVPAIERARLYRGKGGEIMRGAVSRFIECISIAKLSLPKKITKTLLDTLNENLRHPNSQIQNAAVSALKHFAPAYLVIEEYCLAVTSKYLDLLSDANAAVRRGCGLALGVLPCQLLATRWTDVIKILCSACSIEDNPEYRDAEARVNAVRGLVGVCGTLTGARERLCVLSEEDITSLYLLIKTDVMMSLFKALDDYSVDKRGDVGSWVRLAAIDGLERCAQILCERDHHFCSGTKIDDILNNSHKTSLFDSELATRLVAGIAKQAVEKLDKVREAAANALQRILYRREILIPSIPFREKLEGIIPNSKDLEWTVPVILFPRLVKLLQIGTFSRAVLSGLVISTGGLEDSLRKTSTSALLEYLRSTDCNDEDESKCREYTLSCDILWLLEHHRKCNRVITPTLKTVEMLLGERIFLHMQGYTSTFCEALMGSLTIELKGTKDFSKLYSGIAILGFIASISEPIRSRALCDLLSLLGHRYPKIRKASAEHLYLVLLQDVGVVAEYKMEESMQLVSETCWEGDIEVAKQNMSRLFDLAGLEMVMQVNLNTTGGLSLNEGRSRPTGAGDENAEYSSLVQSTGF